MKTKRRRLTKAELAGMCPECDLLYSSDAHAYECALHSNIPGCCADFFVHGWLAMSSKDREAYSKTSRIPGREYIPCPRCVETGKKHKIKDCRCWTRAVKVRKRKRVG